MKRLLNITLLLAYVGGYADAVGFLLTRCFTGHVTGNITLTMIHLAQADWGGAAAAVLSVVAFVIGTAGAEWTEFGKEDVAPARRLRVPLALVCLLAAAAVGCQGYGGVRSSQAVVGLLALAMGFQNGALRRSGDVGVHTTFMTGLTTSLLAALIKTRLGGRDAAARARPALALLAGVVSAFALGAATGGCLQTRFGVWGFAVVLLPLAVALAMTFGSDEVSTRPGSEKAVRPADHPNTAD